MKKTCTPILEAVDIRKQEPLSPRPMTPGVVLAIASKSDGDTARPSKSAVFRAAVRSSSGALPGVAAPGEFHAAEPLTAAGLSLRSDRASVRTTQLNTRCHN